LKKLPFFIGGYNEFYIRPIGIGRRKTQKNPKKYRQ